MLDRRLGPLRTKESMRKLARVLARDERARVLRSTVQRVNGGWVISLTVERSPKARRARRPTAAVGVDVGLARLVTLSTGHVAPNSRPLQAVLGKLRRLQRQLDRQRRAANPANYLSDGRVRPGPNTWARSSRMARTEQRIRRLARHISDVGWGTMLAQLEYKTSWSDGSILVAADRFHPSSKTCSACGAVKAKLSLSERVFTCQQSACGHVQDRDLNAALNLAQMAANHAQAEGLQCPVAAIGAETLNARGGQVTLDDVEHSPVKREGSSDSSRRGDAPALAA